MTLEASEESASEGEIEEDDRREVKGEKRKHKHSHSKTSSRHKRRRNSRKKPRHRSKDRYSDEDNRSHRSHKNRKHSRKSKHRKRRLSESPVENDNFPHRPSFDKKPVMSPSPSPPSFSSNNTPRLKLESPIISDGNSTERFAKKRQHPRAPSRDRDVSSRRRSRTRPRNSSVDNKYSTGGSSGFSRFIGRDDRRLFQQQQSYPPFSDNSFRGFHRDRQPARNFSNREPVHGNFRNNVRDVNDGQFRRNNFRSRDHRNFNVDRNSDRWREQNRRFIENRRERSQNRFDGFLHGGSPRDEFGRVIQHDSPDSSGSSSPSGPNLWQKIAKKSEHRKTLDKKFPFQNQKLNRKNKSRSLSPSDFRKQKRNRNQRRTISRSPKSSQTENDVKNKINRSKSPKKSTSNDKTLRKDDFSSKLKKSSSKSPKRPPPPPTISSSADVKEETKKDSNLNENSDANQLQAKKSSRLEEETNDVARKSPRFTSPEFGTDFVVSDAEQKSGKCEHSSTAPSPTSPAEGDQSTIFGKSADATSPYCSSSPPRTCPPAPTHHYESDKDGGSDMDLGNDSDSSIEFNYSPIRISEAPFAISYTPGISTESYPTPYSTPISTCNAVPWTPVPWDDGQFMGPLTPQQHRGGYQTPQQPPRAGFPLIPPGTAPAVLPSDQGVYPRALSGAPPPPPFGAPPQLRSGFDQQQQQRVQLPYPPVPLWVQPQQQQQTGIVTQQKTEETVSIIDQISEQPNKAIDNQKLSTPAEPEDPSWSDDYVASLEQDLVEDAAIQKEKPTDEESQRLKEQAKQVLETALAVISRRTIVHEEPIVSVSESSDVVSTTEAKPEQMISVPETSDVDDAVKDSTILAKLESPESVDESSDVAVSSSIPEKVSCAADKVSAVPTKSPVVVEASSADDFPSLLPSTEPDITAPIIRSKTFETPSSLPISRLRLSSSYSHVVTPSLSSIRTPQQTPRVSRKRRTQPKIEVVTLRFPYFSERPDHIDGMWGLTELDDLKSGRRKPANFFGPKGKFKGELYIPNLSTGDEYDSIYREIWGQNEPFDPRVTRRTGSTVNSKRSERARVTEEISRRRTKSDKKRFRSANELSYIAADVKRRLNKIFELDGKKVVDHKSVYKDIAKRSTEKIYESWKRENSGKIIQAINIFVNSQGPRRIEKLLQDYYERFVRNVTQTFSG